VLFIQAERKRADAEKRKSSFAEKTHRERMQVFDFDGAKKEKNEKRIPPFPERNAAAFSVTGTGQSSACVCRACRKKTGLRIKDEGRKS